MIAHVSGVMQRDFMKMIYLRTIGYPFVFAFFAITAPILAEPQAKALSVSCQANSPNKYAGPDYAYAIAATPTTVINPINKSNTAYDISGYCAAAINLRRQTTHTRIRKGNTQSIKPYYSLATGNVVPAYTAITANVNATSGSSVCRLCKGLADAKVSGHAGHGMCYGIAPDATGATTNEVSVGWCGAALGSTAQQVVDNCLNSFENEDGGGHKGPIVWDSQRGISCTIGVFVDTKTGAARAGISISYSYPPRQKAAANGENCKVKGECQSNQCLKGRCVGAAGATCPLADSKNCAEHPEDKATCFSKNLACASGACNSGKCQ